MGDLAAAGRTGRVVVKHRQQDQQHPDHRAAGGASGETASLDRTWPSSACRSSSSSSVSRCGSSVNQVGVHGIGGKRRSTPGFQSHLTSRLPLNARRPGGRDAGALDRVLACDGLALGVAAAKRLLGWLAVQRLGDLVDTQWHRPCRWSPIAHRPASVRTAPDALVGVGGNQVGREEPSFGIASACGPSIDTISMPAPDEASSAIAPAGAPPTKRTHPARRP